MPAAKSRPRSLAAGMAQRGEPYRPEYGTIGTVGEETPVEDKMIVAARARIAAQRGELRGWRPLIVGDVAVTAVQVLGMVRGAGREVGI
ncbi:MAG: hypothetical protein ACRDG4_09690, partial [Chloroflexota bacterium]